MVARSDLLCLRPGYVAGAGEERTTMRAFIITYSSIAFALLLVLGPVFNLLSGWQIDVPVRAIIRRAWLARCWAIA